MANVFSARHLESGEGPGDEVDIGLKSGDKCGTVGDVLHLPRTNQ